MKKILFHLGQMENYNPTNYIDSVPLPKHNRTGKKKKFQFVPEKHCRRCGSKNITRIKKSIYAIIYLFIFGKSNSRTYFCKKCHWTW